MRRRSPRRCARCFRSGCRLPPVPSFSPTAAQAPNCSKTQWNSVEFDAVLLLSFGGPEGPEQVRPFLENVTRGRGIPPERLAAVAEHYQHFGGVSPINGINRALIEEIRAELAERGEHLPVYFGNRNWYPFVEDTVAAMTSDGVRRAAVFATSAWGGYS